MDGETTNPAFPTDFITVGGSSNRDGHGPAFNNATRLVMAPVAAVEVLRDPLSAATALRGPFPREGAAETQCGKNF